MKGLVWRPIDGGRGAELVYGQSREWSGGLMVLEAGDVTPLDEDEEEKKCTGSGT